MVMNGISILVPLAEMRDKEGNAGHPESLFLDTPLQKARVKSEEEAFLSRTQSREATTQERTLVMLNCKITTAGWGTAS